MSKHKDKDEKDEREPATATLPEPPPAPDASGIRKMPEWDKPANPGRRFTVVVPNKGFNDTRHGVRFQEGVAYTDDEALADHFRGLGYAVEDAGKAKKH